MKMSWLSQLSPRKSECQARPFGRRVKRASVLPRGRVKPALEALEDRLVLSASITDLGPLTLSGDTSFVVSGVNDVSQVVGTSSNSSSGVNHAFLYNWNNQTLTGLGTLPNDTDSMATGINDSGQVVGTAVDPNTSSTQAFLYSNGQMVGLGTLPGGSNSMAAGINASGDVAGSSDTSSGNVDVFLYGSSNKQMTDLGTLSGYTASMATGINATDEVVGTASDPSTNTTQAFLYSNGQFTGLGTLGGSNSTAAGINASGDVVGASDTSSGNVLHAFLYSGGQMTDLGTLGGSNSYGMAINDNGLVVGYSDTSGGGEDAFLYDSNPGQSSQMTDLNSVLPQGSGWVLQQATAINDADQIVGIGTLNGQTHAFLLNLGSDYKPVITGNPSDQTATGGDSVTFTASASGNPAPTVQWEVNSGSGFTPLSDGGNISGSTSDTLTLTNVTIDMSGNEYQAVFTNSAGFTDTGAATLAVSPPVAPSITGNPTDQTVTSGDTVTFTASATGKPTPSAQWQVSTDHGKDWTNLSNGANVSGATSTTLTLTNVTTAFSGNEYQVTFSNIAGSQTSSASTLTVHRRVPTITSNPSGQTAGVGQTVTFSASATGDPTPMVQWQVSTDGGKTFTNIAGATSTTLTLTSVTTAMNGNEYRAVFSNSVGAAATNPTTLTISQASPTPPTTQPSAPALHTPPLLQLFELFLGTTRETVNADDSVTVTNSFFGFPILVSNFDSSGNLETVSFLGLNVTLLFELL